MASTSAKATAIGGLLVPLVAIALLRPVRSCFLDPEVRNFNRLHLISFHLSRTRVCRLRHFWMAQHHFQPEGTE